jgi:lambda family phage portal protein
MMFAKQRTWLAGVLTPQPNYADIDHVLPLRSAPAAPAPAASRGSGKRAYAGAQMNRLTGDWTATNTSADSEIRMSLRTLRNRSRQLVRDNDYAKSAIRNIRNNVVGKGIAFQGQVMMRRGNRLDEKTNTAIEKAWTRWGRKRSCHTAGKLSFKDIQRMVITSVAESGEVLVRFIYQRFGDSKIPFALEIIESDQLVDEYNGRAENGNEVRMGIEVDEWGRPTAYYLYPKHPGDFQFTGTPSPSRYIRVPAEEVLHLGVPERVGQSRYVPWFHTAIKRLNNLGGYEEAEIVAARATAAVMGFIQSPEGNDAIGDDGVEGGERVYDFEPGTIKELQAGETFAGFNPTRPNAQMDPFMRLMLRGVAAGVGLSYESLSRDYSQSNYSSSRLALLDDRDNWRVLQEWMIESFLQEVYEKWLEMAVLCGVLNLPAYEVDPELYNEVRWMARGWESVDPLKEATANRLNVRSGFTTAQAVISEGGGDYEDVYRQLRRERDLAGQYNLVMESDPWQTDNKGASQAAEVEETDTGLDSAGDPIPESEPEKEAATIAD